MCPVLVSPKHVFIPTLSLDGCIITQTGRLPVTLDSSLCVPHFLNMSLVLVQGPSFLGSSRHPTFLCRCCHGRLSAFGHLLTWVIQEPLYFLTHFLSTMFLSFPPGEKPFVQVTDAVSCLPGVCSPPAAVVFADLGLSLPQSPLKFHVPVTSPLISHVLL